MGNNCGMKKYDFKKYELWFSINALMGLVAAERQTFLRHIRKIWRKTEDDEWQQDSVYLARLEGKRLVRRQTVVFGLETSFKIIESYRKNLTGSYWDILERLSRLKDQDKKEKIALLKRIAEENGHSASYLDDDIEALSLLADVDEDKMRERLFLDCRGGIYKLVLEDKKESPSKLLFRCASDALSF